MFRVKICGITTVADALVACEAGADAIGLNFYSGSPRCCTPEAARDIAAAVPSGVCRVGVFVNASADEIRQVAQAVPLDLVQLHGDETPSDLRALRPLPIMKAFRLARDVSGVQEFLQDCHKLGSWPRLALVDAMTAGQYGGTGKTLDWDALVQQRSAWRGLPLVLAGGLTPDNVAEAIARTRPWGVDVASGVESSPGKKSQSLVLRFVEAARQGFAGMER